LLHDSHMHTCPALNPNIYSQQYTHNSWSRKPSRNTLPPHIFCSLFLHLFLTSPTSLHGFLDTIKLLVSFILCYRRFDVRKFKSLSFTLKQYIIWHHASMWEGWKMGNSCYYSVHTNIAWVTSKLDKGFQFVPIKFWQNLIMQRLK